MLQFVFHMKLQILVAVACIAGCAPSPGPIKRQMIGLLQKFDLWDYNGDGYLVKSELKPITKLTDYTEEEVIDFYDTDSDNRISRDEARDGLKRVEEAREEVEEIESEQ